LAGFRVGISRDLDPSNLHQAHHQAGTPGTPRGSSYHISRKKYVMKLTTYSVGFGSKIYERLVG